MHGTLIYASIHKHSEAGQDRNQAVCALQTEAIVCRWAFNGPTAGHKEHTAPALCYASHWPILGHPEERRQLTLQLTPPCICIWYLILLYVYIIRASILASSSNTLRLKAQKEKSLPDHFEGRRGIWRRKVLSKSKLKQRVGCWLFIKSTLHPYPHVYTHTYTCT